MAITYATYRFGRPIMIDFQDVNAAHSAGDIIPSGNLVLVLHSDLAQSVQGAASIGLGIYDVPKSTAVGSGAALAQGTPVSWNNTTHTVDPDLANGNIFGVVIGSASASPFAAVADADTLVRVLHLPNDGSEPVRVQTVAATGSVQGDAALIPDTGLTWVTAANATKGVILPAGQPGDEFIVKNDDVAAAILKVYPPTGAKINNLAANAAISMAAVTCARFTFYSATQIFTTPTVPS